MVKRKKDQEKKPSVAVNKKAYRNFEIVDKFEAGMALTGMAQTGSPKSMAMRASTSTPSLDAI